MTHIPGIPVALERHNEGELTLEGGSVAPGTPVIVLRAGVPGDNEWIFIPGNNNKEHYAIRNLKSSTFLSFEGEPRRDVQLRGYPEPRDWVVEKVEDPSGSLVALVKLVEEPNLVVDISNLKIFPPLAALQEKRPGTEQAWRFHFHE